MTRKVNSDIKAAVLLIINENHAALKDASTNVAHFISKSVFRNRAPRTSKKSRLYSVVKSLKNSPKK